nr:type 2 DNA topoisomerase 6 subunit B-like [Ipomoea batatas]
MEISSVQMLCKHLIFCAVQRCRLRDDPCRLSVKLTPSPLLSPPLVRISVSDTGIGCKLEEYQHLKYPNDLVLAGKWDGLISISTTGISDNEMHHLNLNIKESVSSKRLTRLPSTTKNVGLKYQYQHLKMLILKIPMVAVELLVDYSIMPGSHIESCILAIECGSLPLTTESITCLRSGLEDYVLKHGNKLNSICQSCFLTGENLKVGTGIASCSGNMQNNRLVMEAVIIISELSELATPSCFREHEMETEIFFFRDFVPCTAPQSSLDALKGISWKSYGLSLRNIKDQGGCALLEWENLPPSVHIDILKALDTQIGQIDRSLTRKAVKLALDDLKEKNQGVLLSRHAQKICNYAPDLAKTIAHLILSSNDLNFQGECCSLLGLQPRDMKMEAVECSIRERIVSVIGKNDQKPQRNYVVAISLLFGEAVEEKGNEILILLGNRFCN